MGSGTLKTLLSNEVPHYYLLYIFAGGGHPSKPCIGLLLQSLGVCSCRDYFFITNAPIINYRFMSLALTRGPISLVVTWPIPSMLGAVATEMSLFVTGVTLNFA